MPAGEFSFDITPQDAIDYLSKRQKTELSWHWSDVQKQEHMRAFTVAKMTSATLLDDVRKSLDKAMAEGQSFQEWRKDIIPKLQGVWLGKTYGELWDGMTPAEQAGKTPPTPEERDRVIKASRLETIFRTNMFNAYAAGRYRQLKEDADIYPYWRYVTAKDSAVRPAHRALEGKVFKADDPFWSTHYPPNGFNCRCIVEAVDEYDLEMQDLKVQEGGNVYFDEESGQTVYRDAEGKEYPCDKGWDYNVGEDPTGQKTLASKKFPPELTKAIREDLKAEAERLKAEAKELEKARRQAEEESRRADEAQKVAEQAKKQAETEAKRKAQEQRKAQAEAERKAKEQSQKAETEPKRFVMDVTRSDKPSKRTAKKAATEEQKHFVVDVTRPDKPSKRPSKKATTNEQKRFVVDVTRPDKPSERPANKAATEEQKRFVVDVTRPDKPSKLKDNELNTSGFKADKVFGNINKKGTTTPKAIKMTSFGPAEKAKESTEKNEEKGLNKEKLSTKEMKELGKQGKEVFGEAIRDRHYEHGAFFNSKGELLITCSGSNESINYESTLIQLAKNVYKDSPFVANYDKEYIDEEMNIIIRSITAGGYFVHNHDNDTAFSRQDIVTLSNLWLKSIVAFTPRFRHEIIVGDDYKANLVVYDKLMKLADNVDKSMKTSAYKAIIHRSSSRYVDYELWEEHLCYFALWLKKLSLLKFYNISERG